MTPLEISIVLHYYAFITDYRDGDFSAPAVADAIQMFLSSEILALRSGIGRRYDLTQKGQTLVAALKAVPLPTTKWVVEFPPRIESQ